MPANRYYLDAPYTEETVSLTDTEFRHLVKVMRQEVGDAIELVDGKGHLAQAKVLKIHKNEAILEIHHLDFFPLEHNIHLLQAEPSLPHLEFILEKGTELGMTHLTLFKGDLSQSYLSQKKLDRLFVKLIAALKQSGRFYLPKVSWEGKIESFKRDVDFITYGDVEKEATPLFKILPGSPQKSYAFYSGPESGFSAREIQFFKDIGIPGVSLHSNTLRTETAPLTYLSLLHHYLRLKTNLPIIN